MKSFSKFLGAAALAAAIVPAAFAETPTAGGAAVNGAQPEHQQRHVQVGRDRTWVHRAAGPRAADAAKADAQSEHQHRYVQVGRDRTWVHLDRPLARGNPSDTRLMGNASAAPAAPSSQDLVGGPN